MCLEFNRSEAVARLGQYGGPGYVGFVELDYVKLG